MRHKKTKNSEEIIHPDVQAVIEKTQPLHPSASLFAPLSAPRAGEARFARPSRKEWLILAGILLAGLLLRLAYLHEIMKAPDFDHPYLDAQDYDYWARALLSGDWTPPSGALDPEIPTTPFLRPPGYPYFLAAVYLITGGSYVGARMVQMFLGLASSLLMFFLARSLFGRSVGLLASAFMAFYWIFIYFEGELNAPPVTIFLLLAFMRLLQVYVKRTAPLRTALFRAAIAGLLFGGHVAIRPEGLLFAPLVIAWLGWISWEGRQWRRLIAASLAFGTGIAAVIAPIAIRNYRVSGELIPIATCGNINLYADNNELADGAWPQMDMRNSVGVGTQFSNYSMPLIVDALKRKFGRDNLTYAEINHYFGQLAWQYIREHPGRTLRLMARKTALFWGPYEITNNKVTYFEKRNSLVLRFMPGFPFAAGIGALGLFLLLLDFRAYWKQHRDFPPSIRMTVLFLLLVATTCVSVLPFHMADRYRGPVIPFLLLLGAYGIARLATFVAERHFRRAAIGSALGVGFVAFFSIPLAHYEYDVARWHFDRSQAYMAKEDFSMAMEELRQAVAIDRHLPFYEASLGSLLARQGNLDEAIDWYKRSLQRDPHSGLTLNNLGYALYQQGKVDEAIPYYRKAIEEDFQMVLAYQNLGLALLDKGDPAGAIQQFEKVLEINPRDTYADYNWGRALSMLGRTQEAIDHYNRTLEMHPNSPGIHNKLALMFQDQGDLDKAIEYFNRAVGLDPQFAPAYFNRAVALACQGKFQEAETSYAQGLQVPHDEKNTPPSLGAMLTQQGKTDVAAAYAKASGPALGTDALAQIEAGNALMQQGRLDQAAEHYRQATAIDPANRDAYFDLGIVLATLGKIDEAVVSFVKTIDLDPSDGEAANRLGLLLARQGKFNEAIAYCRRVLEHNPKSAAAHNGLGNVFAAQGKHDEAVAQYKAAIGIDPKNTTAYSNQARVLALQNKVDEAVENYRKAIDLSPDRAPAHARLAELLARQGKLDEAIEHLRIALRINPNDENARNRLEQWLTEKTKKE
jgi:tetratricopeptide (TPR) repeat protein